MQEKDILVSEVIMYLRKSRSDDPYMTVEEVLEKHERQLQDYASATFGEPVPEHRIFREVVSGETITDRPVMKQVLQLLEQKTVKGVLVIEPQRLSRGDLEDCGRITNAFRYTGTLVITPVKTYDLSSEYDRKFFEMELTRGNDYLEYTKKILNRGRMASARQGNYIGNIAPYGYRRVTCKDGKKTIHTLEIIPEQAETVRTMFQLYLAGNGLTKIADRMNELGIKPLKSVRWSPASIGDILGNPVYVGKIRWGRKKTVKTMKNGEIVISRPINHGSDCILVPGKHPAIVDQELFDAVADRRGKIPKVKRGSELRNPFAGLVFCGTPGCGRPVFFKQFTRHRGKRPYHQKSMICSDQRHCHTKSVLYDQFSARVKKILLESIDDFEIKLQNEDNSIFYFYENQLDHLEKELERLKQKDMCQKDAYEDGIYTKEEYSTRNAKLQEEIAEVSDCMEKIHTSMPKKVDYREYITRFRECLEKFEDPEVSAAEKNLLLKGCIEKIIYHNYNESRAGIGKHVSNEFELDVYLKIS